MNLYMNRKEITDNIREKLGIEKLNAMQRAMEKESSEHIVLLARPSASHCSCCAPSASLAGRCRAW